jgi:nicotinate-nucleotide pyrophosphorylase (carboxylating)
VLLFGKGNKLVHFLKWIITPRSVTVLKYLQIQSGKFLNQQIKYYFSLSYYHPMISEQQFQNELNIIIQNGMREDIGTGDYSSLACIPSDAKGKAKLLVKDKGIIAGVEFAKQVLENVDPTLQLDIFIMDGEPVKPGDIVFQVSGSSHSILKAERLLLNSMQRMSAIATKTNQYVKLLEGTNTQILDTRKTTPGFRACEKWAVKIGGGVNHRFALYDMIMLKDNHIDYAGGIPQALQRTNEYLKSTGKKLKIEVEVRDEDELKQVLAYGNVDRIMLDNFTPSLCVEAVKIIAGQCETEASGGIDENTIKAYAETGVNFISMGALTHSYKSLDLSLKAF